MFRRIVGALLFWGTENRLCHRPTQTWSKVNGAIFFLLLFKERISRKCVCNAFTLRITHTGAHKHAKYEKWKGLQSKILLLCRLHKYKNAYMSWWIVIACIRIRLPHAWADRFLCGDAFSLCACKFRRVNSDSIMARAQLSLKGNGRWDSDWFIVRYAQGQNKPDPDPAPPKSDPAPHFVRSPSSDTSERRLCWPIVFIYEKSSIMTTLVAHLHLK